MITKDSPERQWMLDPKKLEEKSKEEIFQELAKLSGQFKILMENLATVPPPIALSDVEKDAIKYRAQIEILTELRKQNLLNPMWVEEKLEEIMRQLAAVEKVTCI